MTELKEKIYNDSCERSIGNFPDILKRLQTFDVYKGIIELNPLTPGGNCNTENTLFFSFSLASLDHEKIL